MGKREPEFAVEQRRSKGAEAAKESTKEEKKDEPPPEGSWREWLEDPGTMDRMKYFVFAQSFVVFLTMGIPQLQKMYEFIVGMFS